MRTRVAGAFFEYRVGLRIVPPYKGFCSAFEDAALFGGDLLAGAAQKGAVVQAYARYDGQFGVNDIGAVEPASESHFDYGYVNLAVSEPFESQAGGDFKKGEMLNFIRAGFQKVLNIVFADHLPAFRADGFDSFSEVKQMRRGVEPDAHPACG